SHFDAQDSMESGTPGKTGGNGWLNRALPAAGSGNPSLRAVALTSQVPRTLRGEHEAIVVSNLDQFKIASNQNAAAILQAMYATTPDASLGRAGKDAFEAMKVIQSIQNGPPNFPGLPAGVAGPGGPLATPQYGQGGELGRSLQQLARLIKAEAGVEAGFAEMGEWDHHSNENQQLSNLLRQFPTRSARSARTWRSNGRRTKSRSARTTHSMSTGNNSKRPT